MYKKYSARHAKSTKRGVILLIALVLCIGVTLQGTLAFLIDKTDETVNTFLPSKVECVIEEEFYGTVKSAVAVKNTGDTDAYLRVRLIAHRQNASQQIIGGESTIPGFTLGTDWFEADGYYYYKNPVAPGVSTTNLLGSSLTLPGYGDGESQVIEVLAEAIQSAPKEKSAVIDAWGQTVASSLTDNVKKN